MIHNIERLYAIYSYKIIGFIPHVKQYVLVEKEMATHSSVLAWRIPGTGSLVGCRLWGCTDSDTTEAT